MISDRLKEGFEMLKRKPLKTEKIEKKNCFWFTTDLSYCNLVCPKILAGENVTYEECISCGFNFQPNENVYCK